MGSIEKHPYGIYQTECQYSVIYKRTKRQLNTEMHNYRLLKQETTLSMGLTAS